MRVFAVAAIVASTSAGVAAGAVTTGAPTVRVVDLTPITIRGAGFRAGERVRLVLTADGRHVRTVRASGRGSFVASFGGVRATLCTAFQLRATGGAGSVAVTVRKRPPSCAPLDPIP